MEPDQFSLCWNNFQDNLSTGFQDLLKDEDLVDVTLAAEGRYIKAHKTVLSVCSPYFKELFRVNPCKHPIVILHDVKYTALKALLAFMYQGEVSVSQEEIPSFMRVAEILKIKGLTDNTGINKNFASTSTNGVMNSVKSEHSDLRRNRPVKKLKPMQPLRPLEVSGSESPPVDSTPPNPTSTLEPPAKQQRLDDTSQHYTEPTITPKQEPLDHLEDEYSEPPTYEEQVNTGSSAMDHPSSFGECSGGNYGMTKVPSNDISIPGGLMYLKSRKGHPVLIHNGHMYTLSHKVESRSMWVCVKQRTLNCGGCVTTTNGPILLSYSGHNHTQLHDVIQRLQASSCSPSPELIG